MIRKAYKVLNEINLNQASLLHNYNYFTDLNPQAKISPVLKANAYGHGLKEIADIIDSNLDVPYICLDSLYEAYELYKFGVKTNILVMGYTNPENCAVWKKLPFTFGVFDKETLISLNKHQPGAKIHIKLDTGMCRLGLLKHDIPDFIKVLKKCDSLIVEGIFSHFSQADNPSKKTFTNHQISSFKEMAKMFEDAGYNFKWKHISASAGAATVRDPYFNMIRLGNSFYGYTPFTGHTKEGRTGKKELRPALELTTHISQIKNVPIGSEIGYSGTYRSKQKETIAILPLGYNEGLVKRLSNLGVVTLANGDICQIIGNICMNMTIIRLPRKSNAKVGDPVTVISSFPDSPNSLSKHAQILGDSEYTILTGLHQSIRRTII